MAKTNPRLNWSASSTETNAVNIDRLIDRIEKVLREGATDPVFHSLAKEYARYRTIIDQRLDQCVTLIRSGKKFSALELAEESPNALDLMERLSFAGDAKWKELCEEKNIYLGPNFTEDHVDMLEGRDDLAVLWDLHVAEDARGLGIGTQLWTAAEE